MIGECPALIRSALAATGSTPITSWPSCARQAADTVPTYPKPKTLIFIESSSLQRILRCSSVATLLLCLHEAGNKGSETSALAPTGALACCPSPGEVCGSGSGHPAFATLSGFHRTQRRECCPASEIVR